MREIKFRAWDSLHKRMTWPIDISQSREYWEEDWLGVYDFPIMQYTGLKDKNGKEIYEGDIVKPDNDNVPFIRVFWDEYTVGFNGTRDFYSAGTVIGNIYENPELLKEVGDE